MTKTFIEKVASPSQEIAIFKVGGTLGYHENETLKKFFKECKKRSIAKVILDFSLLTSLGGGCARIIREATVKEEAVVSIVGASNTVLKFLKGGKEKDKIIFTVSVEEAIGGRHPPLPARPGKRLRAHSELRSRPDVDRGGSAKNR